MWAQSAECLDLIPKDTFSVPLWYVLYTRSRHEKKVHEYLMERGLENFLPLRTISRRWSDRVKKMQEPLFKGYVFVKIAIENKLDVLGVDGVVGFVSKKGRAIPVPEQQLMIVKEFIEKQISIDPYPYLHCGQYVRVTRGILKGMEGILVTKLGHCRLVISIDSLCQSISVEIDAEDVQPLD